MSAPDSASAILDPATEGCEAGGQVTLKIAERVGAMLDRRGRAKPLLQLASSLGSTFTERQLVAMLSRVQNLGLDRAALASELERLEELGILEFQSEVPPSCYRFRQPAVREVAYHSQSRAQQRLYERLLAGLEAEPETCGSH